MIMLTEQRDKNLINELIELGGKDLLKCYECGTCVADCPANTSEEMPLSVKRLIHICKLGLKEVLIEEETPWMCVTCGACEERCPRRANPFEIVLAIRRWQCKEDETYVPMVLREIFERGHTQNVLRGDRADFELPEIQTVAARKDYLEKFREMLKRTEVVKRYSYMFMVEG